MRVLIEIDFMCNISNWYTLNSADKTDASASDNYRGPGDDVVHNQPNKNMDGSTRIHMEKTCAN